MSRAKAYDPSTEHDALFDVDASGGGPARSEHDRSPDRAVCSAPCPQCHSPRAIGLFRQGPHLVWRVHDLVTVGGSKIPCRASGVAVCDTGIRGRLGDFPKVRCRHP